MNPTKLLIAQRLAEHAREGRAIVSLMDDYIEDPRWAGVAADVAMASETAEYWATEIRAGEQASTRRPAGSPGWTPFDPEASCS